MNLESQVVSLDLAKKLKSLGVKQESLFDWYHKWEGSSDEDAGKDYCMYDIEKEGYNSYWVCSAFTVGELGEILKKPIKDFPYGSHIGLYQISIGYENEGINKGSWECRVDERNIGTQFIRTASTMPDSMALMLIHLLENNLLTPKP